MGPPSMMRSVVNRNVDMWRIPVHSVAWYVRHVYLWSSTFRRP